MPSYADKSLGLHGCLGEELHQCHMPAWDSECQAHVLLLPPMSAPHLNWIRSAGRAEPGHYASWQNNGMQKGGSCQVPVLRERPAGRAVAEAAACRPGTAPPKPAGQDLRTTRRSRSGQQQMWRSVSIAEVTLSAVQSRQVSCSAGTYLGPCSQLQEVARLKVERRSNGLQWSWQSVQL
jgi:hypothetical protein